MLKAQVQPREWYNFRHHRDHGGRVPVIQPGVSHDVRNTHYRSCFYRSEQSVGTRSAKLCSSLARAVARVFI